MRRFAPSIITGTASQRRGFFYAGAGEVGIYGSSLRTYCLIITGSMVFQAAYGYYMMFGPWYSNRQYAPFSTDLQTSDGTEMEGEEAVANLKLQYERIMPFMEEMKAKVEAAESGQPIASSSKGHGHDDHGHGHH